MKQTIAAMIAAFFVLIAMWWTGTLIIFAWITIGLLGSSGAIFVYFFVKIKQAELKTKSYQAKMAKYTSYQDGHGMTYLLNVKTDMVENLTVFPGTHRNGHYEKPTDEAMRAWMFAMDKRRREEYSPAPLLSATNQPQAQHLDLLTIFTQPTQSYAIIGGQQAGKTHQARRIARHWLDQGSRPIVIGPKRDSHEWKGSVFYGEGYNFGSVREGMGIIKELARRRHSNTTRSHKSHRIQPVFFDDWTSTNQELGSYAEDFITKATVLYASVNIILYFIIHLDTAKAWGVNSTGAALKNNFVKLIIEPGYNERGLIDRRLNRGYIIRPGQTKRDRVEVQLFDAVMPASQMVVESPDDRFARMVRGGESRQSASVAVFGRNYAGNSHVRRCKTILGEM